MKQKSFAFPKRVIASGPLWIHLFLLATAFTIFPLVVTAQTGTDSEAGKIGLAHRSAGLEQFKARNYAEAYEEFTEALKPLEYAYGTLATAELMSEFYRLMREEKRPPAKALSDSKRLLREDRRFHHPFYWAPFVLVGN